jgi:hypothetical protein
VYKAGGGEGGVLVEVSGSHLSQITVSVLLFLQVAGLQGMGARLTHLRAERAKLESVAEQVAEAECALGQSQDAKAYREKRAAARKEAEAVEAEVSG